MNYLVTVLQDANNNLTLYRNHQREVMEQRIARELMLTALARELNAGADKVTEAKYGQMFSDGPAHPRVQEEWARLTATWGRVEWDLFNRLVEDRLNS